MSFTRGYLRRNAEPTERLKRKVCIRETDVACVGGSAEVTLSPTRGLETNSRWKAVARVTIDQDRDSILASSIDSFHVHERVRVVFISPRPNENLAHFYIFMIVFSCLFPNQTRKRCAKNG